MGGFDKGFEASSLGSNMESGIWQIVGGIIICCLAFLLKDLLSFNSINK